MVTVDRPGASSQTRDAPRLAVRVRTSRPRRFARSHLRPLAPSRPAFELHLRMRKAALSLLCVLTISLAAWTLVGGAADADRDWPPTRATRKHQVFAAGSDQQEHHQESPHRVDAFQVARRTPLDVSRRASARQLSAHATRGWRRDVYEFGGRCCRRARPHDGQDDLVRQPATSSRRTRAGARRSDAGHRVLDRRQGRAHRHQRRRQSRRSMPRPASATPTSENGQVDLTRGFERPITGWRWSSGPIVVKDVVVVAGVPSPATDILNERARAKGDAAGRCARL